MRSKMTVEKSKMKTDFEDMADENCDDVVAAEC
jgi:hypothetical protein